MLRSFIANRHCAKTRHTTYGAILRTTICSLSLLSMLTAGLPCRAELPPLIPREVLFGNPEKSSPQLSPDGKMLAYLAPDKKDVMNVWIRTLGKEDDRLVTADKIRGIRSVWWQPDGRHVLYSQDVGGDENWHVYQTDINTKVTRDLTPFMGVQARVVQVEPNKPD